MPLLSSTSSSSSSSSGHPRRGLFSSSTSDGLSDDHLLCGEDAGSLSDDDCRIPRGLLFTAATTSSSAASPRDGGEEDDEEVAAGWVGAEADHSPGLGYRSRFHSRSSHLDPASRLRSVAWILKVSELYRFQPVTAYLAVNYMDRFLSCHTLPALACMCRCLIISKASHCVTNLKLPGGWPLQLLAVACLSLAAKMEESLVPTLVDLQMEDATFVFEPGTIQRMELLVLDGLNWRLRSITPFDFISFFACKADPSRSHTGFLVSRATRIILATTEEIGFLGHCPSAVAAAAITCAAGEAPALSSSIDPDSAASWCAGLTKEGIVHCYQLMLDLVVDGGQKKQQRPRIDTSDSVGSEVLSSSSSPSPSSSSSSKRMKLNSCRWADDCNGRRPTEEGDDTN